MLWTSCWSPGCGEINVCKGTGDYTVRGEINP